MIAAQAIHEQWAGYWPLAQLVPADRIYTGLPPLRDGNETPIAFPYASLSLEGESQITRTSQGTLLASELIRITIWSPSYDQADRIERRMTRYFNRRDFRWSGGAVLDVRPERRSESQSEDDGV